jgi:hypothetical protein
MPRRRGRSPRRPKPRNESASSTTSRPPRARAGPANNVPGAREAGPSATRGPPREHAAYWGNWLGGRSTEAVAAAPVWYLAEGATTLFDETITVFNPNNGPVDVTFDFYGTSGMFTSHTERIAAGPGRFKVAIRDWLGSVDHGTRISGRTLGGAPAAIAVERVITCEWVAGQPEGHSTPGVSTLSGQWYFAEGDLAYFATYYALVNPGVTDATVRLRYLHANGQTYIQDVTVPAQRRVTVYPGSVPAGSFGCAITVLSGPPIGAERMLYGGPNWTISHAGVGADQLATTWRFTEGPDSAFFETYLLLANPGSAAAAVTVTFIKTDGAVVTTTTSVPAGGRANVWVPGVPGMAAGDFRTVVSVTNGVPIVAERATYWPLTTDAGTPRLVAQDTNPAPTAMTPDLAGVALQPPTPWRAPVRRTFDPYAAATAHGAGPRLYDQLVGHVGTTPGDGRDPGPDTGPPVNLAGTPLSLAIAPATAATTGGIPWYGAHLTGGRRQ